MERTAKVELFEQIRRKFEFGAGTISGVAHKLEFHWRMVRQALGAAQPPESGRTERERPLLQPLIPFIEAIQTADFIVVDHGASQYPATAITAQLRNDGARARPAAMADHASTPRAYPPGGFRFAAQTSRRQMKSDERGLARGDWGGTPRAYRERNSGRFLG